MRSRPVWSTRRGPRTGPSSARRIPCAAPCWAAWPSPRTSPTALLHGVGANSMHWRFQLAGLSDRWRVIAWNAPGYMLSDGFATDDPDCRAYADAVASFLAALALDKVRLVGNSFGTRVAQCF